MRAIRDRFSSVASRRPLGAAAVLLLLALAAPARAQRALVAERAWTDATGQFTVTAALVAIDGGVITLRQPDGSELEIEIDQLSRLDRLVAQRARRRQGLKKSDAAAEPATFDVAARATNHVDFPPVPQPALSADPDEMPATLPAGRVDIPRADTFDRVAKIEPAGDGTVLVAVENSTPGRPLPTRLVWVAPGKKTVLATHELDGSDIVLDYHPILERLLTVSREKSTAEGAARQVLTLWDVGPARKAALRIATWRAPCGDREPTARLPWGRIVDDALVLHRSSREEITCWDIDAKAARYRLAQYPGHSPVPALSGGRRFVALPDTKRVQVCDTATGKILASLPTGPAWGVAFDGAGCRLAVVQGGDVQVHDLTDPAGPIPVFRAQGCRVNATALAWCGDDGLLVQSAEGLAAVLWSASRGLPVWRYALTPMQAGDSIDDLAERVADGKFLYAAPASARGGGDDPADGTLAAIVCAAIPEPEVAAAAAQLPAGLPALVEPDTVVATKVPPSPDHDRMVAAIGKTFERNGWIYDATSPAVAEAGKSSEGTVSYTDAEGRERQLKQVTPTTLRAAVVVHGITIVEARLSSDIPDRLVLAAGDTEAGLAARLPPPDLSWLERLRLPAVLVDVTEADGLGTSECTAKGLVAKRRPAPEPVAPQPAAPEPLPATTAKPPPPSAPSPSP
ncbi:MAG: SHD1 domain-containing protein [Planctomycetaceae bacterium]